MAFFAELFLRLAPLTLMILAGFLAGRFAKVGRESVAHLLMYIIAPVVVMNFI